MWRCVLVMSWHILNVCTVAGLVFRQEAALCQELHPHPAFCHVHPESCGRVHKGCDSVLEWWHQPLHPFHGRNQRHLYWAGSSCLSWLSTVHFSSPPPLQFTLYVPLFLSAFLSVQFACKASVVFCHYCVMSNFFWLLVEALYLNSLLLSSFYHSPRCLWGFCLLGWGERSWHAISFHICYAKLQPRDAATPRNTKRGTMWVIYARITKTERTQKDRMIDMLREK